MQENSEGYGPQHGAARRETLLPAPHASQANDADRKRLADQISQAAAIYQTRADADPELVLGARLLEALLLTSIKPDS